MILQLHASRLAIAASLFVALLNSGCDRSANQERTTNAHNIQFLHFEGCPNSETLHENLEQALTQLGSDLTINDIDLASLKPGDPLLRFGSPTVLVDGQDIMGLPPSPTAALTCRIYPSGVPTAAVLADLIRGNR